jgi:oxygen-independent coproporphyrinogen-3 oxidase
MSQLRVDLDLIQKYNVAGPRYTSYPPATKFNAATGWPQLAEEIIGNNKTERDLSLYFHVPFCQTLCWYCGCNTVITTDYGQSAVYLDYLDKELNQMAAIMNPKRKVAQLHFGGGTPTFLSPDELRRLGEMIQSRFRFDPKLRPGWRLTPEGSDGSISKHFDKSDLTGRRWGCRILIRRSKKRSIGFSRSI